MGYLSPIFRINARVADLRIGEKNNPTSTTARHLLSC